MTQSKDGKNDALWIRASASASAPIRLSLGAGHYRALGFAPKSESLAFASDAATFADPVPRYAYFVVDASASALPTLAPVLAAGNAGLPPGWSPSTAATPAFSKDTRYLYVGTAPAPTPLPSGHADAAPGRHLELARRRFAIGAASRRRRRTNAHVPARRSICKRTPSRSSALSECATSKRRSIPARRTRSVATTDRIAARPRGVKSAATSMRSRSRAAHAGGS